MSRYIDADELRKEVEDSMERNPHESGNLRSNHRVEHKHFMRLICSQPTADVVPVIHARWEYDMDGIYKCLNCFAETKVPDRMNRPIYEYCPYCGAKMDESVKQ